MRKDVDNMKLNPRDQQIFAAVMSLYCNGDGLPVPSTKIAKQKGMAVCSATVRNAMARLEKIGLLYSPHTSAGRVPTNDGFDYWFDEFFTLDAIANYWQPEQAELVELAHGLSQRYQVCCCVGLPQVRTQQVFRVEVLDFDANNWLILLLDRAGQSHNICINKPDDPSDGQRYEFATWLNTVFSQQTLIEGLYRMQAMANTAPRNCHDSLTQWTRELSQKLGSDNSIVVGENYLYKKIDCEQSLNIGVSFLNFVEDKLAFKNGVSILSAENLPFSTCDDLIVITVPYFQNQEYQSRFCVICPKSAQLEKIIQEFKLLEPSGS
ncbi:heat-inducible transcription repressor HrcA [Pseudoalteromonas sp. DSM 26666]|uniref:HrcA family transcriptional regulator n=1 Tax=Pseudoalteromonas sp. DSM 26666 TaxID=1761892 RepID=UPI0008E50477|nr:HrcA family transcriptional regulator [Pseudoalteromonas sp. DSM 26666]SFT36765.1 heat-inducible transcription repressor HrcA [Pseudoalteromonas sp. DSM 26666]